MRTPPLKALEAVKTGRIDQRTLRLVTHYRNFFRCFDRHGAVTDDEHEIVRVTLSQRGEEYYTANSDGTPRLPKQG